MNKIDFGDMLLDIAGPDGTERRHSAWVEPVCSRFHRGLSFGVEWAAEVGKARVLVVGWVDMLRSDEVRNVNVRNVPGTAIASVVWRMDKLYRIAVVRRSDAAVALFEVPDDLASELVRFDRDAVVRTGWALQSVVHGVLATAEFSCDIDFGRSGLRNGSLKAELGNLRRFNSFLLGVDIGEFELRPRYSWN